ncbi:hypothetical protein ACFX2J_025827 [Malus domestica]
MSKYVKVGSIKSTAPATEGESTGETAKAIDQDAAKPAEDIPSDSPTTMPSSTYPKSSKTNWQLTTRNGTRTSPTVSALKYRTGTSRGPIS